MVYRLEIGSLSFLHLGTRKFENMEHTFLLPLIIFLLRIFVLGWGSLERLGLWLSMLLDLVNAFVSFQVLPSG